MVLMQLAIEMSKDALMLMKKIEYKYLVWHSDDKVTWEFVPKKFYTGQYANRRLEIPQHKVEAITGDEQFVVVIRINIAILACIENCFHSFCLAQPCH